MTTSKKAMTPEEELQDLCDFSVMDCVAVVSEFSPATDYFEPEVAETLIKHLQQTPDLTGVLLDGVTSVHRPGILNNRVVFYNRTEEEVLAHLEGIPRHRHVHWMFDEIMAIEDEWLGKLRAALPNIPEARFIYSIDSDDMHSMVERMLRVIVQSGKVKVTESRKGLEEHIRELNEKLGGAGTLKESDLQAKLRDLEEKRGKQAEDRARKRVKETEREIAKVKDEMALIAKRAELEIRRKVIQDALKIYKGDKKDEKRQPLREVEAELSKVKSALDLKERGLYNVLGDLKAKRKTLRNVAGKQREREALDSRISKYEKDISVIKERLERLEENLKKVTKMFRDFREPETSPVYQLRVAKHVDQMYKRFYKLGKKHSIRIVIKPDILVFGSLVIDYAHDRGRTWLPMPGRVKKLAEAYHGLMNSHRDNVAAILKELGKSVSDLDVVLESGHHGVFFARWQKDRLTDEEIRMHHVNTFSTGGSDGVKYTVYIAASPFEPQNKIAEFLTRQKTARTRGGKSIASANHPVFHRNIGRSVSGMVIIRKHRHGLISVEPICYQLFSNQQVLEPFKAVMSQDDSDNHLNSPEVDNLGTVGTLAMNRQLMKNPLTLYGQKVYLGGTFNLGDTSEANSKVWKEAAKYRHPVMESLGEISDRIMTTDMADFNAVNEMMMFIANHLSGGANENLKLNQRMVLWFLKEKFLSVYRDSPARLRDILASLEGNHFANAVRDVGIKEFDLFEEWLRSLKNLHVDFPEDKRKPFPLQILVGGEPQIFQHDAKEPEIVVHLGGYSSAHQWVIPEYGVGHDGKLLVQKPYRVGMTHEPNAVLKKARNQEADVMKSGHTHESYLAADKSGDNMARFIDQKPCTQRVTATELLYGGLPRTSGVDLCIYSQPGRYFKMTIPMEHMRRIGKAQMKIEMKQAVEKKSGSAKK